MVVFGALYYKAYSRPQKDGHGGGKGASAAGDGEKVGQAGRLVLTPFCLHVCCGTLPSSVKGQHCARLSMCCVDPHLSSPARPAGRPRC